MYLINTIKKFFSLGKRYEIFSLIFGLTFILSFALINMPTWPQVFVLALAVLLSSVFRFISTDESFFEERYELKNRKELLYYIISKNFFALLFTALILFLVFFSVSIINHLGFIEKISFDGGVYFTSLGLVLSSENIILIFNNKMVKSFDNGLKRDLKRDVVVGLDNFINFLASLVSNIFITILIFSQSFHVKKYWVVLFYLISIFLLFSYMTSKIKKV